MPVFLSNCFRKSKGLAIFSSGVTEVKTVKKQEYGGGNFLVHPFEEVLEKAGESKSIRVLEAAVNEAKQSGLLSQSKIYCAELQRLQIWKSAESEVVTQTRTRDAKQLAKALDRVVFLCLKDDDRHFAYGQIVLDVLLAKNNLEQVIGQDKVSPIQKALLNYHSAAKKLEPFQEEKQTDLVLLSDDEIKKIEEHLQTLIKEKESFAKDPIFPKNELQTAIKERNVNKLKLATIRWRRLSLDLNDRVYAKAVGTLEEICNQNKKIASAGLNQKLKERDSVGLKKYLECAKVADVSSQLTTIYEHFVIPTIVEYHNKAKNIVTALQEQDFDQVDKIVSELHLEPVSEPQESMSKQCEIKDTLSHDIMNEIQRAKTQTNAILSESKVVLTAARHVVKSHLSKKRNLQAMNEKVDAVLAILSSFVTAHCSPHLRHKSTGMTRHSMLQSPNDRLVLSRNIINSLSGLPEKLLASINASRLSIQAFETALKHVKDPITTWENQNFHLPDSPRSRFEVHVVNFTTVHDAESVLSILQRLISVSKAENSLTFFETSPAVTPRDPTEVENIVVHIKEGLKLLAESDSVDTNDSNFIDLCYNNPKFKTAATNKETFRCTLLMLDYFSKLFPERVIGAIKKTAEIQLVELKLFCVDEETRVNSARYALKQAIASQSEGELVKALLDISDFTINDGTIDEAEKLLTEIRVNKRSCRDSLRIAIGRRNEQDLEEALSKAEELCLSPTDSTLVAAKRELDILRYQKSRQEAAIEELKIASTSTNIRDIRFALARAKVCHIAVNNPPLDEAKHNLNHLLSLANQAHSNEEAFYVALAQKIHGTKENLDLAISNPAGTTSSFSSRNLSRGRRRSFINSDTLIQCFRNEIEQSLNGKTGKLSLSSSVRLTTLLKCAEQENKLLPTEDLKAAKRAIEIVRGRQSKALELHKKLQSAIQENSLSELASALAISESEPEVLDHSNTENTEELFEMTAQAKENFAMLDINRNSEEYEVARQEISSARRNLKKAMLRESSVSPLREAVETFKLVCSALTPRSLSQISKEKKINIDPEPTTFFFDSQQTKKKTHKPKAKGQKQQERFTRKTKKLYRTHSTSKSNITLNNTDAPNNIKNNKKISEALPTQKVSGKHKRNTTTEHKNCIPQYANREEGKRRPGIEKSMDSSIPNRLEFLDDLTRNSKSSNKLSLKHRPSSAVEILPKSDYFPPTTMLAWEEIDNKNVALLRRAERSLKRIERDEEKRKEDAEKQEFLNSIKDELVSNLRSSIESGDRVDLWQSVHEFTRYFGDDAGAETELFDEAQNALRVSTFSQYKENLSKAVIERNQEKLDHVIYEIENDSSDFMPKNDEEKDMFLKEIKDAKRLATHLSYLNKYRDVVMGMTRSLISEINSYASPPEVIKSVMAATYLLLGESEATVKNWSKVHPMIGKLGQSSLTRRVLRCSAESISVSVCRLASQHLADIQYEKVHAISVGASIFFAWSKCMIFDVLNRNGIESEEYQEKKTKVTKSSSYRRKSSAEFFQRLAQSSKPTRPKRLNNNSAVIPLKKTRPKSAIT